MPSSSVLLTAFAVLLLTTVEATTVVDSYKASYNTWQPDTTWHSVVDLGSGLLHHECAGYCSLRGEAFSEAKCQAFYVDTTVFPRQCHMVPPSKAGETATSAFKFTYFDKQAPLPDYVYTPPPAAPATNTTK